MGYQLSAHFVEPGAIERFYGSGDRAMLDLVITEHPRLLAKRDASRHPATPITDALRDLCDGVVSEQPFDGWRYLYALEALFAQFGTTSTEQIRLSPAGIRATHELALLLRTRLPIALPTVRDFPGAGFMPRDVVDIRAQKLAGTPAPKWATWPGDFETECETYIRWVRHAAELRCDVWFLYY